MSFSARSLFVVLSVLAVLVASVQATCDPLTQQKCLTVVTTTPNGNTLSVNFNYDPTTGTICSLISGAVGRRTPSGSPPTFINSDKLLTLSGTVTVNDVNGFDEATNLAVSFTTVGSPAGTTNTLGETGGNTAIVTGYGATASSSLATLTYNGLFDIDEVVESADSNNDCGAVTGDPVFRGFHGQLFSVKGEAGAVFNLISSQEFSLNSRFVGLASQDESMSYSEMRQVRGTHKRAKLLSLFNQTAESDKPPVTAAWSHPGTYLGECGARLGDSQLYVAPGAYAQGFAAITLNGVTVPVSVTPIELDGDMSVSRSSLFKVTITTRDFHFTIVNSDHFVNIEHAALLNVNAQLSGLLGQTASSEWEVVHSAEWKAHLETDFKLASNELFGADFAGQQF